MTREMRALLTDLRELLKKHDAELSVAYCDKCLQITRIPSAGLGGEESIDVRGWDNLNEEYLTKLLEQE